MAFNLKASATVVKTLLANVAGMGSAQLGVPESPTARLSGSVTAGSQTISRARGGALSRQARINATLAYRLDGNEAAAEEALMDAVDAFILALYANPTLNGTCDELVAVDASLADMPEYIARTAKEYREFPILITVRQEDQYPRS